MHPHILLMKYHNEKSWKIIPLIITSKRSKHLGINLTTQVKAPHYGNYKTLMKLKATQINQNILCSWTERINIVKVFIPKTINVIPIKISIIHEQINLKFKWNHKRSQIAKVILKKKKKTWGIEVSSSPTSN